MVTMPPRHGKSETTSHWFPAWTVLRFPHKRVILTSYEADFARLWGRKVRNTVQSLAPGLIASDSQAADEWTTVHGGGMVTAGVRGPITGRGADLLICDDPVKNADDAHSETLQEATWEWWRSTAITRLEPDAVIVVVMTRWDERDLAGKLLATEKEKWTVLNLPAIAEPNDAMGRPEGAALWPMRYDEAALASIKGSVGTYVWSALYQQRPSPLGGGIFKREWMETRYSTVEDGLYLLPDGTRQDLKSCVRFATVDLAASVKTSADYTVIACCGVTSDGRLIVLEVDRMRREGPDIVPALKRAVQRWGLSSVWIEKVGFQLALVQEARRAGIPVRELEADRDKVARALPLTAAMEGGRFLLPRYGAWVDDAVHELLSFPVGEHDDQVDALAYAVKVAAQVGRRGIGHTHEGETSKAHRFSERMPNDEDDDAPKPRNAPPGGWPVPSRPWG